MIRTLTATGFRCFREIHVEPLTRVNLFVGQNNAGKTSLLEAVELVAVGGVEGLVRSSVRRGEQILVRSEVQDEFKEHTVDPSHLFFGHELRLETSFKVESQGETDRWVKCTIELTSTQGPKVPSLVFESHATKRQNVQFTISPAGGIHPGWYLPYQSQPVNFLVAEPLDPDHLGQLWDDLVLTPGESEVISALKIIEPDVEKLAFLSENRAIIVKLKSSEERLPLGSLGGGLRHLLALVLNLLSARGGFLLVDEIDTGLHYSVMVDMWRLLVETAKRLDVQVFATTHSLDCVRALARLRNRYPETAAEVTVHRVEKNSPKTVVYDTDEIVIAAEGHIEVR